MFMNSWAQRYGLPKVHRRDRGLHNQGVFAKNLSDAGVQVSNTALEALWQLGKVERAGSLWKDLFHKVCYDKSIQGEDEVRQLAREVNNTNNDMSKCGGFLPSQLVLCTLPRRGDGDTFDYDGIRRTCEHRCHTDTS